MLDAVDKRCPAMNRLFNRYYGHDSMCLYASSMLGRICERLHDSTWTLAGHTLVHILQ